MFSKYDVYTTCQSIYCYKDTDILINKFHIKEQLKLRDTESQIVAIKQFELLQNPIAGRYTKNHLCKIHHFLFCDIYPFAGRMRREAISKGTSQFFPPQLINRELDRVFKFIRLHDAFTFDDSESLFSHLSYVMAELNVIHPFRKGNRRSVREFIRVLALHNKVKLNWGSIPKEKLLNAFILSVDDFTVLIDILNSCAL